jgi:hypothetical protein
MPIEEIARGNLFTKLYRAQCRWSAARRSGDVEAERQAAKALHLLSDQCEVVSGNIPDGVSDAASLSDQEVLERLRSMDRETVAAALRAWLGDVEVPENAFSALFDQMPRGTRTTLLAFADLGDGFEPAETAASRGTDSARPTYTEAMAGLQNARDAARAIQEELDVQEELLSLGTPGRLTAIGQESLVEILVCLRLQMNGHTGATESYGTFLAALNGGPLDLGQGQSLYSILEECDRLQDFGTVLCDYARWMAEQYPPPNAAHTVKRHGAIPCPPQPVGPQPPVTVWAPDEGPYDVGSQDPARVTIASDAQGPYRIVHGGGDSYAADGETVEVRGLVRVVRVADDVTHWTAHGEVGGAGAEGAGAEGEPS